MSQNLSAIKRVKISARNRSRNKKYKTAIKKSIKKYIFDINNDQNNSLQRDLSLIYKEIDKAVKRGVWHKNKANRKKSRLAKIINNQL